MPEFYEDLIAANKQLREERDHYRRAVEYLADIIARDIPNLSADYFFDDAMFETAHG